MTVRVLDNLSTGRAGNLADIRGRFEMVKGDIVSPANARKAVAGVKYVFHLAALPSVPRSVEDPVGSNEANTTGMLNMLTAARDAGVERFVFSSSSSVYGDAPELPKREDMLPAPLSPYAVQKLCGEYYCRIFHGLYGFKTFSLRYFNVYGPRQNPKSQYAAVIPIFIELLRSGKKPVIYGDGGQTRDFTFVADVVAANIACCSAPAKAAGKVFNVAVGNRISVNELAARLAEFTGRKIKPLYKPSRKGDVRDSLADVRLANKMLGWKAEVSVDEGLKRTVEWFMQS